MYANYPFAHIQKSIKTFITNGNTSFKEKSRPYLKTVDISVYAKLAISDRQFFASSTKVMLKAVFEIS